MGELQFSVVTVTRNAAAHLARCLQSVEEQTYPYVEHVIIDAVSTDETMALVAARAHERMGAVVSEPDEGIYYGMNKGIARAKGDYVLFLGADDYLIDAACLAEVAAELERAGRPAFAYGAIEVRMTDGVRTEFWPPPPEDALDLMICGCLPHQATFAHCDLFARVGVFDTRYKVQADYDWFLRVLGSANVSKARIDRVVASFAMGGASSSRLRQGQEETYAIQNAFLPYQEPAWMTRRLRRFQDELLRYRVMALDAASGAEPAGAAPLAKALLRRVRAYWGAWREWRPR